MGTLQDQLKNLINSWDNEPQPETTMTPSAPSEPSTPAKVNASRTIFEAIRDGAPLTRAEQAHVAAKRFGVALPTAVATVSSLLRAKLVGIEDGYLYAIAKEYDPKAMTTATNAARTARKQAEAAAKAKSYEMRTAKRLQTLAAKKAAVAPVAPEAPVVPVVPRTQIIRNTPVDEILSTMSIVQARALYDKLKLIFGAQ